MNMITIKPYNNYNCWLIEKRTLTGKLIVTLAICKTLVEARGIKKIYLREKSQTAKRYIENLVKTRKINALIDFEE